MHATVGQLAQALELLSIQHYNIVNSHQQNIYIKDGIVMFVIVYYKGFHASNDVKIIY